MPPRGRVLIVDDEVSLLNLLFRMIEGFGYQCLKCTDGLAAVRILEKERVDVVLTDMVMPEMGGMELIVHCRENYPETDVIVMTGYGRRYSYTDVIKEGGVDFIEKPIDMDELQAKLQRVTREQQMRNDLRNEIAVRIMAEEELKKHQLQLHVLIDERTKDLKEANRLLGVKVEEHRLAEEAVRAYAEKIKIFAYSVSHDLKTPAIAINGLTSLLEKRYLEGNREKVADICRQVKDSSEQLLCLVDNINLFIKAKENPIVIEDVPLEKLFESIRRDFAAEFERRGISWGTESDRTTVRADKLALTRVFRNFVDNSLKYGGEALSRITLSCRTSDSCHTFFVHDDGAGVGDDEKESIFELFSRSRKAATHTGTGMGLAIVREIAEKHNGAAWAEPASGGGTNFFFSIDASL